MSKQIYPLLFYLYGKQQQRPAVLPGLRRSLFLLPADYQAKEASASRNTAGDAWERGRQSVMQSHPAMKIISLFLSSVFRLITKKQSE